MLPAQKGYVEGVLGRLHEGKRIAGQYFFHYKQPKTTASFDLLDSGDRTTVDLDESSF